MESQTQGGPCDRLLRDTVGGVMTSELAAEGGHFSERDQDFTFLSVNVKNKKNLHAALEEVCNRVCVGGCGRDADGS